MTEKNVQQNLEKVEAPKQQERALKKEIKKAVPKKREIVKEKIVTAPIVPKIIPPKQGRIQETQKVKEPENEPVEEKQIEIMANQESEKKVVHAKELQTQKQNVQQEYINENIQKIVQLLSKNLYYPRSARKRGITGEVVVKFRLSTEAKVNSVEVIKSQSELLSRAAVKTIEDLSGKFPRPHEEMVLEIPINYDLKN